jgi:hypothetical protein
MFTAFVIENWSERAGDEGDNEKVASNVGTLTAKRATISSVAIVSMFVARVL